MLRPVALVRGVGSHNGGAELLLKASSNELSPRWSVAADARRVSGRVRRSWGVNGYWDIPKFGPFRSTGVGVLPNALARSLRIYAERHIEGLFDASGFFLGDQWSATSIARDARTFERVARRNRPVVMLPQAFGPFDNPDVAESSRRLLDTSTLIYARDTTSLAHVRGLLGDDSRIRKAPDITIALETPRHAPRTSTIAIVPNINIPTRSTNPSARKDYVSELAETARSIRKLGLDPVLLAHSSQGDPAIVDEVQRLSPTVKRFVPDDGLDAKRFIGSCAGVIGGRYHAVVSALSQAVPAVAHSWSHKYGELLEDFGLSSGLASPYSAEQSVDLLVRLLESDGLRESLHEKVATLRAEIRTMWSEIHRVSAHSTS